MEAYKPLPKYESTIWPSIKDKFEDPDLCPLLAKEEVFQGLPDVYISTCQYDPLRDEGFFYVNRLRNAGVKVIHDHLNVCFHGWTFSHENSFHAEYSNMLEKINKQF